MKTKRSKIRIDVLSPPPPPPPQLQAIVNEVDDDGSGEIEYSEFLTIMWNLKSGKGTSKLATSMSSALSSNIFSKAVKSPFKAKEPQNIRQLWSTDEEDRTRWILAVEECIRAMNEIREADKEKKRERKRNKKKSRKKVRSESHKLRPNLRLLTLNPAEEEPEKW